MKSSIFFFTVVLASSVSAQTDVCGPQNRFIDLLHEVIESKINSTLEGELRLLVEREVEQLVTGAIDQRIEAKVNRTLNAEFQARANEAIKNALINEPGKPLRNSYIAHVLLVRLALLLQTLFPCSDWYYLADYLS